jgi:hypothetical protein
MGITRIRLPAAASLVTALCIGLAGTAAAETEVKQVKTEVKLLEVNRTTFMEFTGKIASSKACRDDRLVTLWYKPSEGAQPQRLGSDRTNRKGAFDIDLASPAVMGHYAATVKKDVDFLEVGDDDFLKSICKGARPIFRQF